MPSLPEHQKCARKILGKSNKLVHQLLDYNVKIYGRDHRKYTHHGENIKMIGELLGDDAKREAVLHILQDLGMITRKDFVS